MATDSAPEATICVVCAEPVDAGASADCNWCNGHFHLNQRNDTKAKDCGEVWIDEQYMALQFACNACLAGERTTAVADIPGASIRQLPARRADDRQPRRRRYVRRT